MKSLKSFAGFLLEELLEEYITIYLSHINRLQISLMKLFVHLSPEQLRELSKAGVIKFLAGFRDGTALEQAAEGLRQWETDSIPGVPKNSVHPSDLVLIYTAQKFTLYHFISSYTSNLEEGMKIAQELEEYYAVVQNNAIQMLFKMQKETEQELNEKNRQLEEAQFLAHIGSWEWDVKRKKITWSNELYRIFGMKPQEKEITPELFKSFLQPHEKESGMNRWDIIANQSKAFSYEYTIVRSNGELRTLQTRGGSVFENGVLVKVHGTTQDITEIKEAEIQKQLNKQKDEFISIASHELKTPLTSIKAYIQLLGRSLSKETRIEGGAYLEKTNEHINRLNDLILELLDVSKIQAGKLRFELKPFNFKELVEEILTNNLFTNHHAIILKGDANITVVGDKQRLSQVLFNLISNAVQYSPKADKVLVNVDRQKSELKVSITDFGIGISKEKQNKIFERYYRVDNSGKQSSGLGLGLFISSEIIKQHKGKIGVESEEGKGSTFYFTVPLEAGISRSKSGLRSGEDIAPIV